MIYAVITYIFWGLFPLYWKLLNHVSLIEILANRVLWSFVFYSVILFLKNNKVSIFKPKDQKTFFLLSLSSVLLMTNWLLYIYAVNSGQIIAGSLGYFINPLFNILLGVILLKEKLSQNQKIAVGLAVIGVGIITFSLGHLPWISLVLASTFSFYGYLKKTVSVSSLESNQFESLLFVPLAIVTLLLLYQPNLLPFVSNKISIPEYKTHELSTWFLFLGSGIVTGLPLLLFSEATKKIPYYMIGFLQFIAPTLQFLTGLIVFNEPLSQTQLIGFIFIWIGVFYLLTPHIKNLKIQKKESNA